ncbi:MAG TPA: thiamine pyrophosphate-dependent enzyme [Dehalococcoidia bacterium]|nr:thiamine pyrophosphate-dependent enzyme [Dehalococcoidia bacterium]
MEMFLSGNQCIAHGAKLSRVEVISAYPITPATPASEELWEMVEHGELDADIVNSESELGAMGICVGASAAGCRTFNCTCSQGFALMREMLWAASGMALPVVLAIASREIGIPQGLLSDYSDSLSERDASFLQFYCENGQEIIDSLIMAYRVSEDERVLLPSLVVTEGHRVSHSFDLVDVPEQEKVDKLLPKYQPKHVFVDPDYPMSQGAGVMAQYPSFKMQQYQAMQEAKQIIKDVCQEYAKVFGRSYDLVEAYKTEDAEFIIVGMGSMVSVLRDKVDEYRQKGIKIGMLKLRVFRPFPEEEVRQYLSNAKKVLVIDRACTPGNTLGISCLEIKAALRKSNVIISNYIISGRDFGGTDVDEMFASWSKRDDEFVEWFKIGFDERTATISGSDNWEKLLKGEKVERQLIKEGEGCLSKGTASCAGCLSLQAIRQVLSVFDKNVVIVNNAGCLSAVGTFYPLTGWKAPFYFFTYSHAGAAASGMEVAMKRKGIKADIVLVAGDGAIFDIGLQTFSAALERGHRIIYLCYDNQAYMNTGVQKSGSTPYMAKTKTTLGGRQGRVKNIEQIVAAHGDIYIATASSAFPEDLLRKVRKAKSLNKPSFIHIICPCPPGWEYEPELGIEIARLGVETGTVVLYEYENGKTTVNYVPRERKPVEEYIKKQGRFSRLTKAQIAQIQKEIDGNFYQLTGSK